LLTLAGSEGRIQLVLRNSGDQGSEKTDGQNLLALYGGKAKPAPSDGQSEVRRPRPRPEPVIAMAPPPALPPAPVVDQIITIRGVDKKIESVTHKKGVEDTGRNP
jgi:hypothetical protein